MRKKHVYKTLVAAVITLAVSAAALFAQITPDTPAPGAAPAASAPAIPTLKGLKDAFEGKFLIGTACDPGNYSQVEQDNIKHNYNIITPENCMKPQPIHPSEDTYNWTQPDNLVKWCEDNKIQVWGHNLCWHSQVGPWFFQGENGAQATKEQVLDRLHKHITTVVSRYKGRILGWDVVNEAIADGGGGGAGRAGRGGATTGPADGAATAPASGENLRVSNWSRICGPEFLSDAFKWAHEADPNARLTYNDYNIEQGALRGTGKHAASMALLKRLIADKTGITGVGIQGHWSLTTNLAEVEKAIEDYESLGLKIAITELDVTVSGGNSGAMPTGGAGGPVANDAFTRQAQFYAKLFDIFQRHSKSIERVTLWGISDRRSWRSGQSPLLFDGNMQPKPAVQAILDVAAGKPLPQ